jgi:hypothetical protein
VSDPPQGPGGGFDGLVMTITAYTAVSQEPLFINHAGAPAKWMEKEMTRTAAFFAQTKSLMLAFTLAIGLSVPLTAVSSLSVATQAEAGTVKKVKTGIKLIGRGAGWVEKKLAKSGKVGRVISRGAGGIRKGSNKLVRGIGKVQKGAGKAFSKVCKGACRKVVKTGNKVRKGINYLKREADRKCRQFGRNSQACKVAMGALELASPI